MNVVLWVIAILLAVVFLGAGVMKLRTPKATLQEKGLTWTEDFSDTAVKAIGGAEALGAIGLVLPPLVKVAPVLAPIAATCLALTMAGAVVTHLRRGERKEIVPSLVLGILSAVVAWGRFGPYAF